MPPFEPPDHEEVTLYLIRGRAAQAALTEQQHSLRHAVREMYRSREECTEDDAGHECYEHKVHRMCRELRELVDVGRMLERALMVLTRAQESGGASGESEDQIGEEMEKAKETNGKGERGRVVYLDGEGMRREEWVERKGGENKAEVERAFSVVEKVVWELERGFGNGRETKL